MEFERKKRKRVCQPVKFQVLTKSLFEVVIADVIAESSVVIAVPALLSRALATKLLTAVLKGVRTDSGIALPCTKLGYR